MLDINMPAGGGVQMLEWLRRSTRTARIPIVVVTATLEPGLADMLLAKGAREVLAKPVTSTTLLQAVRHILGEPPSA